MRDAWRVALVWVVVLYAHRRHGSTAGHREHATHPTYRLPHGELFFNGAVPALGIGVCRHRALHSTALNLPLLGGVHRTPVTGSQSENSDSDFRVPFPTVTPTLYHMLVYVSRKIKGIKGLGARRFPQSVVLCNQNFSNLVVAVGIYPQVLRHCVCCDECLLAPRKLGRQGFDAVGGLVDRLAVRPFE